MQPVGDKILIIGGYGAVGSVISRHLAIRFPGKVIIAGRDKQKAVSLITRHDLDVAPARIDLSTASFEDVNFSEIHTVISCVEYLKDDLLIHKCLEYGTHYTELATSYEAYARFSKYKRTSRKANICIIPGVGLMPGLSGVFVKQAIRELGKVSEVHSFISLGLGENHGSDAIRWMLGYSNKPFTLYTRNGEKKVVPFSDGLKETLLGEEKSRTFYRFNFGDQHIIKKTLPVESAETRLAFDSAFVTWLIAILEKTGLLSLLSKTNPDKVKKTLELFRFGSDRFAVQTHCYSPEKKERIFLAEGHGEAYATGIIAAYAVSLLYMGNNLKGILRLEEVANYEDFVAFLIKNNILVHTSIHPKQ